MRYPDGANEFGCRKVKPDTVRGVISLLLKYMTPEMPVPRIEPRPDGGLLVQFHEYWVDCEILAIPGCAVTVQLSSQAGWCEPLIWDETLFPKAIALFERLRKEGPPRAKKPDDGEVERTAANETTKRLKPD